MSKLLVFSGTRLGEVKPRRTLPLKAIEGPRTQGELRTSSHWVRNTRRKPGGEGLGTMWGMWAPCSGKHTSWEVEELAETPQLPPSGTSIVPAQIFCTTNPGLGSPCRWLPPSPGKAGPFGQAPEPGGNEFLDSGIVALFSLDPEGWRSSRHAQRAGFHTHLKCIQHDREAQAPGELCGKRVDRQGSQAEKGTRESPGLVPGERCRGA